MRNQIKGNRKNILRRRVAQALVLCLCALWVSAYADPSPNQTPAARPQLPLLIFDASKTDELPNYENNYFVPTEILTVDNKINNTPSAAVAVGSKASVHNLSDRESTTDKKHDYFVRFEDDVELLGLFSAREYFVLGGMDDKSLIRNYIGYSMAKDIFDNAPDIQLCELMVHDDEAYKYQGVYLLVAPAPEPDGFLLQRSTQPVETRLETYADAYDDTIGELTIPLRKTAGWDDSYNAVLGRLSWSEEVLYYETSRTFYQYQEMFDVESFVSGFLLGELTGNYFGMHNAYYDYNRNTERLSYAPIWNFEHAFDNDANNPATSDWIYYTNATYFHQLFKSPSFAKQIQTTYLQLRTGALDEQRLMNLIDDAVALVTPAIDRDWLRWNRYGHVQLQPLTEIIIDEKTTREIEPFSRQRDRYQDEILRMKTQLREHSLHFAVNVTQFNFQEREISKEIVLSSNPIGAVVFIVFFFVVVRFVRKYGV